MHRKTFTGKTRLLANDPHPQRHHRPQRQHGQLHRPFRNQLAPHPYGHTDAKEGENLWAYVHRPQLPSLSEFPPPTDGAYTTSHRAEYPSLWPFLQPASEHRHDASGGRGANQPWRWMLKKSKYSSVLKGKVAAAGTQKVPY